MEDPGSEDVLVFSEVQPASGGKWRIRCTVTCEDAGVKVAQAHTPGSEAEDEDGDARVARRAPRRFALSVRHVTSSSVRECGKQVWAAALLMADYLLHVQNSPTFRGACTVELGAGVGLPGMVLGRVCKKVFLTDCDDQVLDVCLQNVEENDLCESCCVRRLDWSDGPTRGDRAEDTFTWGEDDLDEFSLCKIFLACDVVYERRLTDSFVSIATRILREDPGREMLVAIEKRVCFTFPEMASTAKEYDYFFAFLELDCSNKSECLRAARINIDFPQGLEYDRTEQLELWRLRWGAG